MTDPTLYLYTSLTADSSHVAAASSRLEGILAANELPFRVVDTATDDVARALWGSRSQGRALPALVQSGAIVGVRLLSRLAGYLLRAMGYAGSRGSR
jgi:hypothetical protein